MAEEEDVVFVNSPLFEHLTEVGFTDFDAQCFNNVPEQVGSNIGASRHLESSHDPINHYLGKRFVDFLKRICGFIWYFVGTSTNSKEIECHSSYLSLIKASKLLTEDSEELIFRFEKSIFSSVEHDSTSTGTPVFTARKRSWFTFINSNIIIGFMVLLAIILDYFTTTDGRHLSWINTSLFTTSLGVFLGICTCKICFIWWNIKIDYLHDHNLLLLRNYFEAMEGLLVLSRKAVLFIQEKELLARGHIIISPMVPIARIESNSAQKTIKHCIVLRKCIFTEINNCLGILQNETKALSSLSLFENSQIFSWFDNHLLSIDTTKWLNAGLDVDTETNEFSLVLLKQIIRCLVVQQSSLLCYTSLMSLFIVADKKKSQENYLAIIKNCFERLLDNVNKHSLKIKQCYRFHQAGAPPGNVRHETKMKILNSRLSSTFSPFAMAVHSMNIHLQEATKKSLSIEEKLEEIDLKTTSVEEFAVQHFDEIESDLMCMKRDLNNLTSCWDESHNRLHGLSQRFIAQSEKKERCAEEKTCDNPGDNKDDVQILSIDGDIDVVPDQVFEGETLSELDDDRYCSPTLDSEELYKEKKVREENSYLLQELKSVLATKDRQTMVGLPRALLSKKLDCESTCTVNKQAVDILDITSGELLDHSTCMNTCKPESNCEDQSKCDSTKSEEISIDKDYYNHRSSQSMLAETDGNNLDIDAGIESSVVNPFASMIAAAALARNKEFGFKEQRYELDGQSEIFGDKA